MSVCNEDCFNCPYEDCIKVFNEYTMYPEKYKRYAASEKGKENERRKRQRKKESGKSAEYSRTYYWRHREEILKRKKEARQRAKQQLEEHCQSQSD